MLKKLFVLIMAIIIIISCEDDKNITEPISDDMSIVLNSRDQLFPLEVNDYWIYDKYTQSEDTSYHQEYKLEVTRSDTIDNEVWFIMESSLDGVYNNSGKYLLKNDSVYIYAFGWGGPLKELRYIVPKDSIEEIKTTQGGDVSMTITVQKIDTTITTPLYNFDNCYSYSHSGWDNSYTTIIKYGIGKIKMYSSFRYWETGKISNRIYSLVETNLITEP